QNALPDSLLSDPKGHLWASMPPLNTPRFGHRAVLLPNGTVLVAGGSPAVGSFLQSSEIFDNRLSQGSACAGNTDCSTGYCVDGVCCDTACNGVCVTCI